MLPASLGELLMSRETHLTPTYGPAGGLGRRPHITVYGDDYENRRWHLQSATTSTSRTFAKAHLLALQLLLAGHAGGALQSRHRHGLFGARDPRGDRERDRPRSPARRQAAPRRRPDLSGRRRFRRARDVEIPPRSFGSGDHHPDRMGVAPQGSSAEGGQTCRTGGA